MKALTWKTILSNLSEAYRELKDLHACLYYLTFGKLPDDWPDNDGSYKAFLERREKRHLFTEYSLYISLEHAFYHLNMAWNTRRTSVQRYSVNLPDRWHRFPKTRDFLDLWPSRTGCKKGKAEPGFRKISLTPVRVSIQMAQQKLGILCNLVERELGEGLQQNGGPSCPKGDAAIQPLTEKEFARRMHRIYAELNTAWNSRRDRTFVIETHAIQRRKCFSSTFIECGILTSNVHSH